MDIVFEERFLPTVAALGYVMGNARNDYSCYSGHSLSI